MVLDVSFRHACGHFDPAALAAGFSLDLALISFFRQSLDDTFPCFASFSLLARARAHGAVYEMASCLVPPDGLV